MASASASLISVSSSDVSGIRAGLILDRVDQGDLVAAARGRPELVERRHRRARDLAQAVLELVVRHPELLRDLLVRRRSHQLLLERCDRTLDLPRSRANRARHPVQRAQLVDDRAADARHRERLELDLATRVEALDRADQPEQPVRHEILLVDVRGEARAHATGDELHQWRVGQDQAVAKELVSRLAVFLPESLRVSATATCKREYAGERRTPQEF